MFDNNKRDGNILLDPFLQISTEKNKIIGNNNPCEEPSYLVAVFYQLQFASLAGNRLYDSNKKNASGKLDCPRTVQTNHYTSRIISYSAERMCPPKRKWFV